MKTFEEFRKKVFEAIENSNLSPEEIIELESSITFLIPNEDETPEHLKSLSARLEAEKIRFRSSVSVPSQIHTICISVYNS